MKDLVYYLSVNTLKENSTLDKNIEDKVLQRSIIDAQDIDIQNILGTDLYESINTKIKTSSLTGNYKTLMDNYIQPCLLKFTIFRALLHVWIKLRNSSAVNIENDEMKSVEEAKFNRLRREASDDAEYYSNRLKDYLYYNSTLYPEYNTNTDDDVDPSTTNSYFCGIQLDGNDKCYGWKYK